jgi:integrase
MLTVKWLEARANKPQEKEITKAHRDGLHARVRKTGAITFIFRYTWEGKREKINIGRFPTITLGEAVKVAKKYQADLANDKHPGRESKIARVKIAREHTVKSLAMKWWEEQYQDHPDFNDHTRGTPNNVKRSLEIHIFPRFEKMPWEGLDRVEWAELFRDIKKRSPSIAARLVGILKQISNYAFEAGITKHMPLLEYSAKNSLGISKKKTKRQFDDVEIYRIYEAFEYSRMKESNKIVLKLMFIYGCRTIELRLCEPKHLDIKNGVWTVPKELNKPSDKRKPEETKPIKRPLFTETILLFERAMQLSRGSKWVFPKTRDTKKDEPVGPGMMLDIPHLMRVKILDKYPGYDMASWSKHDIRRTVRTRMAKIVSRDCAESMLGHVLGGTEDVYNHNDFLEAKLIGYQKWYQVLDSIWNKRDNVTVIGMKKGA